MVKEHRCRFDKLSITHCYKETNKVADAIATLDTNEELVELDILFVKQLFDIIVREDASGKCMREFF